MPEANPYQPPIADTFLRTEGGGVVPDFVAEPLRQTRPWVRFLAVLGFIGSGLLALLAIPMAFVGALSPKNGPGIWMLLIYLPLAALYVPPSLFLWRYGGAISRFLADNSHESLTEALQHQKSFWRFAGISVVVVVSIYFAAILVAIGSAFLFHR